MSLFDTLLGEEVGRADAVRNDAQNIFLKQRYLKLQREGKFDEAFASLQPGYVPSEEAASAAGASGASGPLSTSPEIQGLLTAARRSQEEAAQANVGNQGDGTEEGPEEYNWGAVDPETGQPYISDRDLSKIISEGDKKKSFNPFDYTTAGRVAKAVREDRVKKASEEATKRYRMIEPTGNPSFSTGITYSPDALPGGGAVTASTLNNPSIDFANPYPGGVDAIAASTPNTYGFGDIDPYRVDGPNPSTAGDVNNTSGTGTFVRFPSALDNPEMPLTLNNLNNAIANSFGAGRDVLVRSGGLLGEIGEHPDAQIKGGGLLNTGPQPFVNSPTFTGAGIDVATLAEQSKAALEQRKMNDAAAAQAAAVNAANIAANISRPDDQERSGPEPREEDRWDDSGRGGSGSGVGGGMGY